jgi:hypothetical protein
MPGPRYVSLLVPDLEKAEREKTLLLYRGQVVLIDELELGYLPDAFVKACWVTEPSSGRNYRVNTAELSYVESEKT